MYLSTWKTAVKVRKAHPTWNKSYRSTLVGPHKGSCYGTENSKEFFLGVTSSTDRDSLTEAEGVCYKLQ